MKRGNSKGPSARKRAAKKAAATAEETPQQRPPHIGEEARIALRRQQVLLATAGGASIRQIAAELDVAVGTVHEDLNAELLAVRDANRSQTENWRDLERMRLDTIQRQLHPVLTGPDHALRVQAGRVLVQVSVQRARLLGLYQHEGATENAPQDFLVPGGVLGAAPGSGRASRSAISCRRSRRRFTDGTHRTQGTPTSDNLRLETGRPPLARRRRPMRVAMMIRLGLPSRMFGFCALCTLTRRPGPARCATTPVGAVERSASGVARSTCSRRRAIRASSPSRGGCRRVVFSLAARFRALGPLARGVFFFAVFGRFAAFFRALPAI